MKPVDPAMNTIEAMKEVLGVLVDVIRVHGYESGTVIQAEKTLRQAIEFEEIRQNLDESGQTRQATKALRIAKELDAVPDTGADPDLIQEAS